MASCRSRGWRTRCRRKLTNKGLRQADSMANWLKQKLPENIRDIVSPAKRTQQTAMAHGYFSRYALIKKANGTFDPF
jgi:phosphohistidine phosphatase SixA